MSQTNHLNAALSTIIAANPYLTLATADEEGLPWASPVWYASVDNREFFWISSPDARHSRNIAVRPEVAIVIFDSQQHPGTGQTVYKAVYLSARAERVPEADLDRGLGILATTLKAQGLPDWSRANLLPPAKHRFYRAIAVEHILLTANDERIRVAVA
jgi:nitroimidazol reductase NimA-like FMN-containing flavoprotein (pyridoxamine 5'-phosphate oxidase superfamily)